MNLFQRYLAEEFAEDSEEGRISRRDALKLIASVTGSLVVANSILAGCTAPEETAPSTPAPTDAATAQLTDSPASSSTSEATATEPAATSSSAYGTVMPNEPAVLAGDVQIPAADTHLIGYLARPSGGQVAPIILG